MKNIAIFLFALLIFINCSNQGNESKTKNDFSFLFMTDIHLKPGKALDGFKSAIDTANKLESDFVITGGDLVYDVMRGNFQRSDSLFTLFKNTVKEINKPVYNCIGNHELFGIYDVSDIDSTHPDYKYGMYKRHFGNLYYSFDHKGWHFMVLNSLDTENKKYIGKFGADQLAWIKDDLSKVSQFTPICVILHLPLITTYDLLYPKTNTSKIEVNSIWDKKEFFELFPAHKLKLVLQGHYHWIEDINVREKTRFITGGSIAGRPSWGDHPTGDEGFMKFNIKGEEISWEYIRYKRINH